MSVYDLCLLRPWLSTAVLRASFQQQFWVLRASVSQADKECGLSWVFLSAPALAIWAANLPFNMTFLYNDQKGTFIWKQITSFILACIQWGAKKRNCSFLMVSEIQNRNYMVKAGRVLHQPVAGSRFCGQSVLYTIEGTADTDCFFFGQNIWKMVKFMKEITKTSFLELNCFCLIDILLLVWMVIFLINIFNG